MSEEVLHSNGRYYSRKACTRCTRLVMHTGAGKAVGHLCPHSVRCLPLAPEAGEPGPICFKCLAAFGAK